MIRALMVGGTGKSKHPQALGPAGALRGRPERAAAGRIGQPLLAESANLARPYRPAAAESAISTRPNRPAAAESANRARLNRPTAHG